MWLGGVAVSARARPRGARQSIFLIKEILFDYLIDSVAQKLTDLAQIEVEARLFKNGGVATNEYTWSTARIKFHFFGFWSVYYVRPRASACAVPKCASINFPDKRSSRTLTIDGQINLEIKDNTSIKISISKKKVHFLLTEESNYFNKLRSKMGWFRSIENY